MTLVVSGRETKNPAYDFMSIIKGNLDININKTEFSLETMVIRKRVKKTDGFWKHWTPWNTEQLNSTDKQQQSLFLRHDYSSRRAAPLPFWHLFT